MKKTTFVALFVSAAFSIGVHAQQTNQNQRTSINPQSGFDLTDETIESIEKTGFGRCLTDENELALKKEYPNRGTSQEFEAWLAPKIEQIKADRLAGRTTNAIYNIPVVVHIVHNGDAVGTGENISDAQALSQIQVMNEDFRRMAGSPGGSNTTGLAVDVEINFCMAEVDPNGASTNGIVRHNITPYSNNVADTDGADWETRNDVETMKAATQWDPTQYLNMWTIRPGGNDLNAGGLNGLLGYAQFPDNTPNLGGLNPSGGAANTDGVVAGYNVMGTIAENDGTFIMHGTYNLGRTMTHEVGHWVGLRHVWGDGDCSVDDFCADTPNAANPNYNCNVVDSCTGSAGNDQVQNYMDYSNDACMDTFTQDQKDRIQAIMGASPRRVELTSSTACSIAPTIYIASTLPNNINEGSDCNYTDITIDLGIAVGSSASTTVSLTNTGTATENVDFEFLNNSATIAQGATAPSNAITLRIHNDGLVEADETIVLGLDINTTGNAVAATNDYNVNIINDDEAVGTTNTVTYFNDDFDDQDYTDWTFTDSDNDGNNWGNPTVITNTNTGEAITPLYSLISRSWSGSALTPDNWAVSPAIDLSSATGTVTLSWITQVAAFAWDEEKYSVHVGTTNDIATLVNAPTSLTETLGDAGNTGAPTPHTLDISALAGEAQVYVALRHWDVTDQDFISVDDLKVTATLPTNVQTTINSATADNVNVDGTGTTFFTDSNSGDVMIDVDNTGGFDYGCTTVEVSRDVATAGADAVMYQDANVTNYVTAKTFGVATANVSGSDNASVSFYFTEAEIAGWETVTGNNRSDLFVKKEGTTDETTAITITSFGTHLKLSASFTTGIDGTFYFGVQQALLSANDFSFENSFSISPNPNNGTFAVKFNGAAGKVTLNVFDIRGRSVLSNAYNATGDFNQTINLGNVQSGMYLLNVNDGSKTVTKKIIVE